MDRRMTSKAKNKKQDANLHPGTLVLMRVLAVAALLLAAYLASIALSGSRVAGCGPESGCDQVLQSRWSKWFGIPVSLPAIGLYLAVILFLGRLGPKKPVEQQRQSWKFLFGCAIAVLGAAL